MILEGVQKVFGTLDLFVSLLETEIKYPILQGGILPFWTPSLKFIYLHGYILLLEFYLLYEVLDLIYLNELQKFHCHYSHVFVPLFDLW